jgi:hypothetical protein
MKLNLFNENYKLRDEFILIDEIKLIQCKKIKSFNEKHKFRGEIKLI